MKLIAETFAKNFVYWINNPKSRFNWNYMINGFIIHFYKLMVKLIYMLFYEAKQHKQ